MGGVLTLLLLVSAAGESADGGSGTCSADGSCESSLDERLLGMGRGSRWVGGCKGVGWYR